MMKRTTLLPFISFRHAFWVFVSLTLLLLGHHHRTFFVEAWGDDIMVDDEQQQRRATAPTLKKEYTAEEERFLDACVKGPKSVIQALVEQQQQQEEEETSTDWLQFTTHDGEHCLHLAAIEGATEVTQYLLQQEGTNPNVRSTFRGGLRMHPLSWNVYAGHVGNIRALLDHPTIDVNADFDDTSSNEPLTVLDLSTRFVESKPPDQRNGEPDKFDMIHEWLLEKGAKRYRDL